MFRTAERRVLSTREDCNVFLAWGLECNAAYSRPFVLREQFFFLSSKSEKARTCAHLSNRLSGGLCDRGHITTQ